MSIRQAIQGHVTSGLLVHVPTMIPGTSAARHVFLTADLHRQIMESLTGSGIQDGRLGKLLADLEYFTAGGIIAVGNDPFDKDQTAYMARTYPPQDGIFDIRSADPKPGLRLFGAFSEPDVFVGLTWRRRKELGDRSQRLFEQAILAAMKEWDALFPNHRPFYSENLNEHVTSNLRPV
jgi:hypothetical protein